MVPSAGGVLASLVLGACTFLPAADTQCWQSVQHQSALGLRAGKLLGSEYPAIWQGAFLGQEKCPGVGWLSEERVGWREDRVQEGSKVVAESPARSYSLPPELLCLTWPFWSCTHEIGGTDPRRPMAASRARPVSLTPRRLRPPGYSDGHFGATVLCSCAGP